MNINIFVPRICPGNSLCDLNQKIYKETPRQFGVGMQKLKAAEKSKGKNDDQYFCVSDNKEEKDWLSDVPVVEGSTLLKSAGDAKLCIANMRRVLESDSRLHAMTVYDRKEFGMLYRAFVAR